MKIILTALIIFLVYRFFVAPPALDEEQRSGVNRDASSSPQHKERGAGSDDEYIDYEEVE